MSGLIDKEKTYIILSGVPIEEINALSFSVLIHVNPEETSILKARHRSPRVLCRVTSSSLPIPSSCRRCKSLVLPINLCACSLDGKAFSWRNVIFFKEKGDILDMNSGLNSTMSPFFLPNKAPKAAFEPRGRESHSNFQK